MPPSQLKAALITLDWSQAELARRIGYAPNTVSRWITGEMPTPKWLDAYMDALIAIHGLAGKVGVIR